MEQRDLLAWEMKWVKQRGRLNTDVVIKNITNRCRIQELEKALKFMLDSRGQPLNSELEQGLNNAREVLNNE